MKSNAHVLAVALLAVGLAASGCGSSSDSGTKTSESATTSTTVEASTTTAKPTTTTAPAETTTAAAGAADLQSLIPTPADTQRTDGPDQIPGDGIHTHFLVNGAPMDVMAAYKTALEGGGWTLVVERSGGGGGGGGATYTGTNGTAYGVFAGGGYGSTTDINSCAWPQKPSNTKCGRD